MAKFYEDVEPDHYVQIPREWEYTHGEEVHQLRFWWTAAPELFHFQVITTNENNYADEMRGAIVSTRKNIGALITTQLIDGRIVIVGKTKEGNASEFLTRLQDALHRMDNWRDDDEW